MTNGHEDRGRPTEKESPEREKKEREQPEKWIRKIQPPSDFPSEPEPTPDKDDPGTGDGGNELTR